MGRIVVTAFGDAVRRWRTVRSLTQEELAVRARLTVNAVGALERGERRRPYPHTVRALADALDLDDNERARLAALVPGRAISPTRVTLSGSSSSPALSGTWTGPLRSVTLSPGGSPVIGRDDVVAQVCELLRVPRRRIVTLTGTGGVGKTTVAALAATRVQALFTGGVVVVELDRVAGPTGVLPAITNALGAPEPSGASAEALAPFVEGRHLLLMLDNLEHVLDAAAELAALVAACPELVVLATSRAPLRIRGEQEVPIGPLVREDAIRLFRERLRAAGAKPADDTPTDDALNTLCERTDGLPLAIELAASAAARIGPTALVSRLTPIPALPLRDVASRHRSITSTLSWSHDLLTGRARALLARLSVCIGGFSLDIAEAVGGTGPDETMIALTELIEHSMVMRTADVEGTDRFRLLEPIRSDAAARLGADDRTAARSRLAYAVVDGIRGLADDLEGPQFAGAARLLASEMSNLRIAVEVLVREERTDEFATMMWSIWRFLAVRGHAQEALGWTRLLRGESMSEPVRARWLVVRGALAILVGDLADGRRVLARARGSAARSGDPTLLTAASVLEAQAAAFDRDETAARDLFGPAEFRAEHLDNDWWRTQIRIAAAEIATMAGDPCAADHRLREAEESARRLGNPAATSTVLFLRGVACTGLGRDSEAARLLVESVDMAIDSSNTWNLSYAMGGLAGLAVVSGEPETAAWLLGASSSYASEHDAVLMFTTARQQVGRDVAAVRAAMGDAAFDDARRRGRNATVAEARAAAHAVAHYTRS